MPRAAARPHFQPKARPEPRTRRYKVLGKCPVGDAKQGEVVELSLTDAQEKALLSAGAVEPAPEPEPEQEPENQVPMPRIRKNRPTKAVTTTEQE